MSSKIDLKVVLLGKEYGGKTSLVERFMYGRFDARTPYQNTIGAAFGAKSLFVDGKSVTLGVWDTAGSERYEAMSKIYYRGAKAAVICYDLTDGSSWERAKFWIAEVRGHEERSTAKLFPYDLRKILQGYSMALTGFDCTRFILELKNCRVYLCGTKKDLLDIKQRALDYHDTVDYADSIGSKVIETSSKSGEGIEELFECIAEDFVREPDKVKFEFDHEKVVLGTEPEKKQPLCSGCPASFA